MPNTWDSFVEGNAWDTSGRRHFDSIEIVKKAAHLDKQLSSNVLYLIDGEIDLGTVQIDITGININISGMNGARETAKLYSTEDNYTMFIGSSAGSVYITELGLSANGTGSKLFDITNSGTAAFEFQNVNFGGFGPNDSVTSMGEVNNYRQGFMSGCGFYFVNDGLTLSGEWGGFVVQDSNAINPSTAMTLFKEGTSLTFDGSVRSNMNFLSVNSGSEFADFREANFLNKGAFSLNNFRTSVTDAVPNIPGSSVYARYRNCDGIKNTYVGAQWTITSTAATVISAISVPVKIAGTTTYSDEQWFDNTTSNACRYIGDQSIEVEVKGNLSFTGTNGDVINIYVRLWDDSASSYVDLSETAGSTLNASGRAEGVAFNGIGTMNNNDRIEIWVENESGARNVTAELNGYVIISERAS